MKFAASLALACAFLTGAQAQSVKYERYKLPNGLTVILHEDHTVPLATINTWFYVGSKDEQERRSGFAHLFEHLMFMGTERVPGNLFDRTMEAAGGANNASTSEDRTNYFSSGPSNLLPTLLWLDADRLEDLGRLMDQKKLDLQREVVRNERRENVEQQPYGEAYEALSSLLYPKGHPYHTSVIGSHEDLQAAAVKDVQDFFATYYVPNNASLVVAGDFDSKTLKPIIAKFFGSLPRKNDPPRKHVPARALGGVKRATLVDKVPFSKIIMAWHSPSAYKPGDVEINMAGSMLTGGVSSRLYQELVVKQHLATEVSAYQNSLLLGSYFALDVTAEEGVDLHKLEKAVDKVVAEFVANGPTEKELKRQSAVAQTGILGSLQSIERKADRMNEYQFYVGEPDWFAKDLARIRAVTKDSMKAVLQKTLDPNARVILKVVAKTEAVRADRDAKPEVGAEKAITVPKPVEFTLDNGIKVQYFQRPDVPLMSVQALVGYGTDNDPAEKSGLAGLVAEMTTAGTGALDSKGFEEELELLGAGASASAGRRFTHANFYSLSANFEPALTLWADSLMKPSLQPNEMDRVKTTTLAQIDSQMEDPAAIAGIVADREYFGSSHAASRPAIGLSAAIEKLTLADVRAAHAKAFCAANTRIFASGSLDTATLKAALNKALAGWNKGQAGQKPAYPKLEAAPLRVVVVDVPEAPQTVIQFRLPAPTYSDPNRIKLNALNTILGGSFTSRLNQNLREDKGYTYGAGSRFALSPDYGYLTARASVRADVTGASIKEFLAEFARLRAGDVSDEEAGKARSTLRADSIGDFASINGLVALAAGQAEVGKQVGDVATELSELATLDAKALNAIAKQAIPIESGVLILVGDKKSILEQLKGLGLPEPKITTGKG